MSATVRDLSLIEQMILASKEAVIRLEDFAIEELEQNGEPLDDSQSGPWRDRWGTTLTNLQVLMSRAKAAESRVKLLLGK
jgi:hypothetical protein